MRDGLPEETRCRAEQHLFDPDGSLGRVDLRFDAADFTLLVENKLHSGYGTAQLRRYSTAARSLSATRTGLMAVTRNVPTYGEEALADEPAWLGSVRWAQLVDEGLGKLPIRDAQIRRQWQALLEVMREDGDLGTTEVDAEVIRAWAQYTRGRDHLEEVLGQIWEALLEILRDSLKSNHRVRLPAQKMASPYRRGQKGQILVQRAQLLVWLAYCVPENVKDPQVWVGFNGRQGEPTIEVGVSPWDAHTRLQRGDRQLTRALELLRRDGFLPDGDYWTRSFRPDEYLGAADVPARLIELVGPALKSICESKVLRFDITATVEKRRGGPPRGRVKNRV